jgi:hypothetical protein
MGQPGTDHAKWEKQTWQPLKELAEKHPEAGIHFQDTIIYNRKKDQETATGLWFSSLMDANPWYRDVVLDVRLPQLCSLYY